MEDSGTIFVLKVEPGEKPYLKEIDNSLESLQGEVGGYIEAVYPFDDDVSLICNEEGKILNLPLNRALYDNAGEIVDIVCGDFLIVGTTDDSFRSLNDEQIRTYNKVFYDADITNTLNIIRGKERSVSEIEK